MNLQQIAEGLRNILDVYPQLLSDNTLGSTTLLTDVEKSLNAFSFQTNKSDTNGKRKTRPADTPDSVPLNPSKKSLPSVDISTPAADVIVNVPLITKERPNKPLNYGDVLCEYIAQLLLGSSYPVRSYQEELVTSIVETFHPILPYIVSKYASIVYTPVFPSINTTNNTLTCTITSQSIKSSDANVHIARQDALLSTLLSFSILVQAHVKTLPYILTYLTRLPISIDNLLTSSTIHTNANKLINIFYGFMSSHPFVATFFNSFYNSSVLTSMITSSKLTSKALYKASMTIAAFHGLSDSDTFRLLDNICVPLHASTTSLDQIIRYTKLRTGIWHTLVASSKAPKEFQDTLVQWYTNPPELPNLSSNNTSTSNGKNSTMIGYMVDTSTLTYDSSNQTRYVPIASAASALRSIKLALHEPRPILLDGAAGSGKSILIDHLAHCTNNKDYIRIYIDDQLDSKTLLGTQTCTDIPGEFVWKPGALAQAMMQGRWVILEDIQRAQFEVLASLIPLFETNSILLPGRGEILTAAPGFRLFATWTNGTSSLTPAFVNYINSSKSSHHVSTGTTMDVHNPANMTSGSNLSLLLNLAGSASSQNQVLLHQHFTRVCVSQITIPDIIELLTQKYAVLANANFIKPILDTARCFAAPGTISDIIGVQQAKLAATPESDGSKTDTDSDSDSDDDSDMNDDDTSTNVQAQEPEKLVGMRQFSPFGPSCMVTYRHVARFAERVHTIVNELPKHTNENGTYQVQLNQNISLDITRAAIDCFAAAAPPATSQHILERRNAIISAVCSIWQLPYTQYETQTLVYKPNIQIVDHEVRIQYFALPRNLTLSQRLLNDPHMSKFSLTRHALLNMERIFAAVHSNDPLLLVGETGNGKTTIVQYLAAQLGQTLHVHNMNQQSEASDLLGGFKPVELRVASIPLMNEFGAIFPKTFSREGNKEFLMQMKRAFDEKNWKALLHYFKQTLRNVTTKLKNGGTIKPSIKQRWIQFGKDLSVFEKRVQQTSSFAFWFAEGSLVKAIREGHWILLDEVNLASSETLDRLASLLEDKHGSLSLVERGDSEVIPRHPNFRLFACMNPATDAGKKNLPAHIRDRFCELYVTDIEDEDDLHLIIREALGVESESLFNIKDLVSWFLHVKALSKTVLFDGAGYHPHYSPRSLVRALRFAKKHTSTYGTYRALYEGINLSFSSPLSAESRLLVDALLWSHIFLRIYQNVLKAQTNIPVLGRTEVPSVDKQVESQTKLLAFLNQYTAKSIPKAIEKGYIVIGPHAVQPGSHPINNKAKESFIITPSVEARLGDVARGLVSRLPVLLQGPTSAGKTSLVTYLADITGNKCVRINNHLHTDVQEYIGSYVTGNDGSLVFQEGVLVTAVRNGYWIILDELNLAPSEVLESLNRLLDDNQEIFIPETQETVRAHPNFLLFATQNPPGLYGGRKVLSRAFTNRFVQLHCDDIPEHELITIIEKRCKIPPTYAEKMVDVMKTLQIRRQSSLGGGVFAGKKAMLTPRDLFRWADRKPTNYKMLAEDGFMLLGERLRNEEGKVIVKEVLEEHCKCELDLNELYSRIEVPVLDGRSKYDGGSLGNSATSGNTAQDLEKISGGGKAMRKARKEEKLKKAAAAAAAAAANTSDNNNTMQDDLPADIEDEVKKELAKLGSIAWTFAMKRLFALVYRCVMHNEPVLLVGATGAGKTTVCQILGIVLQRKLEIINCHQHTETSDFLGGLRPLRGKERVLASLLQECKNLFTYLQTTVHTQLEICANNETLAALVYPELAEETDTYKASGLCLDWIDAHMKTITDTLAGLLVVEEKKSTADSEDADTSATTTDMEADTSVTISDEVKATIQDYLTTITTSLSTIQPLAQSYKALFEWKDGVLVTAMKEGSLLLLDEISLADDAVLERLNSVLEPSRTLFLAEKGGATVDSIVAHPNFAIVATMNPGGDFGKKELSPALRNRFTEVWVPQLDAREDMMHIIMERFLQPLKYAEKEYVSVLQYILPKAANMYTPLLLDFIQFYNGMKLHRRQFSLRDILAWVGFMTHLLYQYIINANITSVDENNTEQDSVFEKYYQLGYLHAAALVTLDGLAVGAEDGDTDSTKAKTRVCIDFIASQLPEQDREYAVQLMSYSGTNHSIPHHIMETNDKYPYGKFGLDSFYIPCGKYEIPKSLPFATEATSSRINMLRVLRAMQLPRAVLLEGSPGVGKTSLIAALAKMTGHNLVRINLSEQTDMLDLLGSDLPVHGGEAGQFAWCDGVFLQALKAGDWVLLDELNLASQSVLEGLNAVLDHRAQIYLPELNQTIECPPTFRLFAAQNPVAQGGGRKGLPASFLNRFTKVWLHPMVKDDMISITQRLYPQIPLEYLTFMLDFNQMVHEDTMVTRIYGREGSPWEFNLRDVFRWCDLVQNTVSDVRCITDSKTKIPPVLPSPVPGLSISHPGAFIDIIYLQRMRTNADRDALLARFREFSESRKHQVPMYQRIDYYPTVEITPTVFHIGNSWIYRRTRRFNHTESISNIDTMNYNETCTLLTSILKSSTNSKHTNLLLSQLLRPLEHLTCCVARNLPVIISGQLNTGKTSLIRMLANITNNELHEIPLSSSADSTDLLGCFEQVDWDRHRTNVIHHLQQLSSYLLSSLLLHGHGKTSNKDNELYYQLTNAWNVFNNANNMENLIANGKLNTNETDEEKIQNAQNASTASIAPCFKSTTFEHLLHFLDISATAYKYLLECKYTTYVPDLPKHLQPQEIREEVVRFQENTTSAKLAVGRFEWIDGTLIQALEQGHWVLLENVNFCNPSVLDRLNGLLEPNGTLLVNECGLVDGKPRIITPHKNFRIFLTMNPVFGEVSRAMRNRCVELTLTDAVGSPAHSLAQRVLAQTPTNDPNTLFINPTSFSPTVTSKDTSEASSSSTTVVTEQEVLVKELSYFLNLADADTVSTEQSNTSTSTSITTGSANTPVLPSTITTPLHITDILSIDYLRDLLALTSSYNVPGLPLNMFLARIHMCMQLYVPLLASISNVSNISAPRYKIWSTHSLTRWASLFVSLVQELPPQLYTNTNVLVQLLFISFHHTYALTRFSSHAHLSKYISYVFEYVYTITLHTSTRNNTSAPTLYPLYIPLQAKLNFPVNYSVLSAQQYLSIPLYIVDCMNYYMKDNLTVSMNKLSISSSSSNTGKHDMKDTKVHMGGNTSTSTMILDDYELPNTLALPLSLQKSSTSSIMTLLFNAMYEYIVSTSPHTLALRYHALQEFSTIVDTYASANPMLHCVQRMINATKLVFQSYTNENTLLHTSTAKTSTSNNNNVTSYNTMLLSKSSYLLYNILLQLYTSMSSTSNVNVEYLKSQPFDILSTPIISPSIEASVPALLSVRSYNTCSTTYKMHLVFLHLFQYQARILLQNYYERINENDMLQYLQNLGTPLPASVYTSVYPLALSCGVNSNLVPVHKVQSTPVVAAIYPLMVSLHNILLSVPIYIVNSLISNPGIMQNYECTQHIMAILHHAYILSTIRTTIYTDMWSRSTNTVTSLDVYSNNNSTTTTTGDKYTWNYGTLLIKFRILSSTYEKLMRVLKQYPDMINKYVADNNNTTTYTFPVNTYTEEFNKQFTASYLSGIYTQCEHDITRCNQALMTQSGGDPRLFALVGLPSLHRVPTLLVPSGPSFAKLQNAIQVLSKLTSITKTNVQDTKPMKFYDPNVDPSTYFQVLPSTYTPTSSPFTQTSSLWLPPHIFWAMPRSFKDALIDVLVQSQFARSPLFFDSINTVVSQQLTDDANNMERRAMLSAILGRKLQSVETKTMKQHKLLLAFLATLVDAPSKLQEKMTKYIINAYQTRVALTKGEIQANGGNGNGMQDSNVITLPNYTFLAPLQDVTVNSLWKPVSGYIHYMNTCIEQHVHMKKMNLPITEAHMDLLYKYRTSLLYHLGRLLKFLCQEVHVEERSGSEFFTDDNNEQMNTTTRSTVSPQHIAALRSLYNLISILDKKSAMDNDIAISCISTTTQVLSLFNQHLWNNALVAGMSTRYNIDTKTKDVNMDEHVLKHTEQRVLYPKYLGLGSAVSSLPIHTMTLSTLPKRAIGVSIAKRNTRISQLTHLTQHMLAHANYSNIHENICMPKIHINNTVYTLICTEALEILSSFSNLLTTILPGYTDKEYVFINNVITALLQLSTGQTVEYFPTKEELLTMLNTYQHNIINTISPFFIPIMSILYDHVFIPANKTHNTTLLITYSWCNTLRVIFGLCLLKLTMPIAPVDPALISQHKVQHLQQIAQHNNTTVAVKHWNIDNTYNTNNHINTCMNNAHKLVQSSVDLVDTNITNDPSTIVVTTPIHALSASNSMTLNILNQSIYTNISTLQKQTTYRDGNAKSFAELFDFLHAFEANGFDSTRIIELAHSLATYVTSASALYTEDSTNATHAAMKLLQREYLLQDISVSFLNTLQKDYLPSYPDICEPIQTAVYMIKTGLRDITVNVSSIVSGENLSCDDMHTKRPVGNLSVFPETTRVLGGTLYSLLSFPHPMLPSTLMPAILDKTKDDSEPLDILSEPLVYLLSKRVTAAIQMLGNAADKVERAKRKAINERRAEKQRAFELSQAEIRKKYGDAYGEDVVSIDKDINATDITTLEEDDEEQDKTIDILQATETNGDDGMDGLCSDDEEDEDSIKINEPVNPANEKNYSQLPLLIYRAVLLRFIVAGLMEASGPIIASNNNNEPVAAMNPKLARVMTLLYQRVLASHRKKIIEEQRRKEEEAKTLKTKSNEDVILTEEQQLQIELQAMYPDYSDIYDDIMHMNDQFKVDLNDDEEIARKEAIAAQRAQADLASANLIDEDVSSTFLSFKLLFACAQSSISVGNIEPCIDVTKLKDAVTMLRSLAITATHQAAALMISALQCTNSAAFLPYGEVDAISFPSLLYSLSTAHTFLSQHVSLSGVSYSLEQAHKSSASATSLSAAAAQDIKIMLDGLCASLCPSLSPMPPVDTTNKKLSWKKMTTDNDNARAGTDTDVKLIYHDVWRHPNMAEIQRLIKPIQAYQNRVRYLLTLFPSHPVLHQLALLAQKVASQPLDSPVMKILTGCELLLKKSEEWESYAHRGVKLKKELYQITILVARWRKLELHSWPMVLKRKDDEFENATIPWWCRLYPIVHCSPQDVLTYTNTVANNSALNPPKKRFNKKKQEQENSGAANGNVYDNYFLQLHTALQEFIVYSNLGEIKSRLAILLAFRNQIDREIQSGFAETAAIEGTHLPVSVRKQVMYMLESIFRQYIQFLPAVMKHFADEKLPLERTIVEQVRLAVWDLSNYWALKDSTEKSHKKVHKLAQDYEILLKTPFSAVLQKVAAIDVSHQMVGTPMMGNTYKIYVKAKTSILSAIARADRIAGKVKPKKKPVPTTEENTTVHEDGTVIINNTEKDDSEDMIPSVQIAKVSASDIITVLTNTAKPQPSTSTTTDAAPAVEPITVGQTTLKPSDISSTFVSNALTWLEYIQKFIQMNNITMDSLSNLPNLFARMLSILRKSILSDTNTTNDVNAIYILEELSITTIQRVETLTKGDGAPIQTKKRALADTIKLLQALGLSSLSSAAGMLAFSDQTLGSLTIGVDTDVDIFTTSALPPPPTVQTAGLEGDEKSSQHDIHTASLSLLSSNAAARGANNQDNRMDSMLNILSSSFFEMHEHSDEHFDMETQLQDQRTVYTKKPQKIFRELIASGLQSTKVIQLPLWFLKPSLSASFSYNNTLNIPMAFTRYFTSKTNDMVTSTSDMYNTIGNLNTMIYDLSEECDTNLHETYTNLRKMRTRTSVASTQTDVSRAQIVKLQGMMEHYFFICSNSLNDIADIGPSVSALQYWTRAFQISSCDSVSIEHTMTQPLPCTLLQLSTIVRGLVECAETEYLLLQRLSTILPGKSNCINKYISKLHDTSIITEDTLCQEYTVPRGILVALRHIYNIVSSIITFVTPEHLSTSQRTWVNIMKPIINSSIRNIIRVLHVVLGQNITECYNLLPFSSYSHNPLLTKAVGSAKARLGLASPTIPFLNLCEQIFTYHKEITQTESTTTTNTMVDANNGPSVSMEATNKVVSNLTNSILILIQEMYHNTQRTLNVEAKEAASKPKPKQPSTTTTDENGVTTTVEEAEEEMGTTVDNIENVIVKQLSAMDARLQKSALTRVFKRLHTFTEYYNTLLSQCTDTTSASAVLEHLTVLKHSMALLTPFLSQLCNLYQRQLLVCLGIERSALRYLQLMLSLFNIILVKGLCRKPDEPENSEEGDGETTESGTGMGEGSGSKDVSDQIQDEQQLLGTKNERQEEPQQNENQDTDTGKDMENDFDGELLDVPKNENEQDDNNNDDDENKPEREMGELDEQDDQDVVDERLWNNNEDNEEEIDRTKEKHEESEVKGTEDSKETVAGKDEEEDDTQKEDKKKKHDDDDDNDMNDKDDKKEEIEPQVEEANDDQEDQNEEDMGQVNMADEHEEEEDSGVTPSSMPDDVKMDEDGPQDDDEVGDEETQGDGEGDDVENDDENDQQQQNDDDNTSADKEENLVTENDDGEDDSNDPGVDEESTRDETNEENEASDMDDDQQENDQEDSMNDNDVAALPDIDDQKEQDEEDENAQEEVNREENAAEDQAQQANQGSDADLGQVGGQDTQGSDNDKKSHQQQPQSNSDNQDQQKSEDEQQQEEDKQTSSKNNDSSSTGETSAVEKNEQRVHDSNNNNSQKPPQPQKLDNPFASLGDSLKKWKERMDILEAEGDIGQKMGEEVDESDEEEAEEVGDMDDNLGEVQHAQKNEKADAQVLASVDKDDQNILPKLPEEKVEEPQEQEGEGKVDASSEDTSMKDDEDEDEEESTDATGSDGDKQDEKEHQRKRNNKMSKDSVIEEVEVDENDDDLDELLKEFDDIYDPYADEPMNLDIPPPPTTGTENINEHMDDDDGSDDTNDYQLTAEDIQTMRDELDQDFDAFNSGDVDEQGSRLDRATKMWQNLMTITAELSQQLCERLRIILEPSLASKLAGDFRTGKRINIKKIIPFIASQFRKDKIWLRRTAPNKRNYQILIAIDNSGSMRSNHAGRVALEALTLICQALTQLEVGEMSVMSFGDQPKLLHPFQKPFTPESGAYVVSGFQFDHKQTQWMSLLRRVTGVLENAREDGGDKENLQLVFIISDARIQQDREAIAKLARDAMEKRQLLCLLIIDTDEENKSILSMKKVTTVKGGLKVTSYLEDFPFPYYTILRDIQMLPETVADALRQWFELVQRSE